jgi:hypothetical protein
MFDVTRSRDRGHSASMSIIERLSGRARRRYRARGYDVFKGVLPVGLVDKVAGLARTTLVASKGKHLRQSGRAEVNEFFPGTPLIRNSPSNLHLPLSPDLHAITAAVQELITTSALAERLSELDGATHYHINQTLLFSAAQTTAPHVDSWAIDTVPHGGAHTLWIPLQDMEHQSGIPAVIPWPVGKLISEQEFGLSVDAPHADRYERYQAALAAAISAGTPEVVTALARRGDVLVWSSLTPHFTLPSRPFPRERLSMQVLLWPAGVKWGAFAAQPDRFYRVRTIAGTDRFSFFVPENIYRQFGIGSV